MKKRKMLCTFRIVMATLMAMAFSVPAYSSQLLCDDFEYQVGDLYGQGAWVRYGTQANAPVKVVGGNLTFAGYQDSSVGMAVALGGTNSSDQDLQVPFSTDPVTSGAIYVSALVKFSSVTDDVFFLTYAGKNYSGFGDGKSNVNNARLFACKGSADGKFKLGLSKNAATPADRTSAEYDLGTTYLVVMKYEFIDGSNNDELSLWVNPANAEQAPEATLSITTGSDYSTTNGMQGIALMQNGSSVKTAPELTVDAVRVADTWADLFVAGGGGGEDPDPAKASITVGSSKVDFSEFYVGGSITAMVNVKAAGLTGDIAVEAPSSSVFTVDAASIPASQAMSASGYNLSVTFKPSAVTAVSDRIILSADGADDVTVALSGSGIATIQIPMSSAIINQKSDGEEIYRYTGKAVVTYVDAASSRVYAQDMVGGMALAYYDMPLSVGDEITCVIGGIIKEQGVPFMVPYIPVTTVNTGKTKEPTEATLADILADPDSYIHRLVKVAGLTFDAAEGTKFTTASLKVTDGAKEGRVMPFAGTDLIGTEVPSSAVTVVGISKSVTVATVSPRSTADIIAAPPSLEITPEVLFDGEAAEINRDTPVARYTVRAENLPSPLQVYLTGADRSMFSLSHEEIAKGSSVTEVTVTYSPTAIGKHTARINFDTTPAELATGSNFTFYAYDPANPPVITADNSVLRPFAAKVGESQMQEITVTTANFVDYGRVRVMGESNGAFVINSTSLLKNGNSLLKITFTPKSEGSFSETIELSGMKAETVYLKVTGSTTAGADPEEQQGDKLELSTDNPRRLLVEDFSSVTRNQPLKLDGWCNAAVTGTRAWWGYDWTDGNKAAKITAYDSKVETGNGTPCQMMLVTPPLDFVNSASKLLTFRIMGDMLLESQTDLLEVCYIDMAENDMYVEPLQGMNIPVSADYNGEWIDYVIDLEGQQLADVFFIGFRFTSTRGADNTAQYYVDDVTYGRTDVPQIKPGVPTLEFEALAGRDCVKELSVSGLNLSEGIKLTVGGPNPSNFTLSHTTLPATGGDFTVTFNSEAIGVHEAYVTMSSAGAPDAYILMAVNNKASSGITIVIADSAGRFIVYDLNGVKVLDTADPADVTALPSGIYIVNGVKYMVD